MDLGLTGKAYLVTGASRGLGYATAAQLVAEGASVLIASRHEEDITTAAGDLGCVGMAADLADPDAGAALVSRTIEAHGRIDGAVVSVGGPPAGPALAITDAQWSGAFDSVFLGAVRVVRSVVPALPPEGGSIVLVLSTSAKMPVGNLSVSNGLRPGLAMLAKTLADELGPQGVRVNGLLPGRVDTDRVRSLDGPDPAVRAGHERGIPLRRYGDPAEFGRVAAFLLSPAASYVTGAMVPVDGGISRGL
ncbi:MAG TPA: SDR family oxidoreductase [Mycobacteriales bacterium]|nr:SDR family oxidoreductase [Mycobacteriales bacterium]